MFIKQTNKQTKNSTYKWTHAVQTHAAQGSTIILKHSMKSEDSEGQTHKLKKAAACNKKSRVEVIRISD